MTAHEFVYHHHRQRVIDEAKHAEREHRRTIPPPSREDEKREIARVHMQKLREEKVSTPPLGTHSVKQSAPPPPKGDDDPVAPREPDERKDVAVAVQNHALLVPVAMAGIVVALLFSSM